MFGCALCEFMFYYHLFIILIINLKLFHTTDKLFFFYTIIATVSGSVNPGKPVVSKPLSP